MSGLTEAHVLCVSVQKEFSKRQSDRQEVDLLIQDACERETSGQATGSALRIKWATIIIKGKWEVSERRSLQVDVKLTSLVPPSYW